MNTKRSKPELNIHIKITQDLIKISAISPKAKTRGHLEISRILSPPTPWQLTPCGSQLQGSEIRLFSQTANSLETTSPDQQHSLSEKTEQLWLHDQGAASAGAGLHGTLKHHQKATWEGQRCKGISWTQHLMERSGVARFVPLLQRRSLTRGLPPHLPGAVPLP